MLISDAQPIISMHVTRGCLVVPIQTELYDDLMLNIQRDVLEMVRQTGVRGVIIDVSGVNMIDSFLAQTISDTGRMASLLGAKTVITGFNPGVVASLIDLDFELRDIQTAATLEGGFQLLTPTTNFEGEREDVEEAQEMIEADAERKVEKDIIPED